jgi:hypothetical protein
MTEDRRYGEDEVREIFELATHQKAPDQPSAGDAAGLTLAEIQDIGREVGLEPAVVARAAAALETRTTRFARRTSLGMPIAVGRIVQLPRPLSEAEWEQLVVELRATFGARGRATSQGNLREWVNGNLHAFIEPAEGGYRLRIGTLKGDAAALNAIGAIGIATGFIAFGSLLLAGASPHAILVPAMLGASGVGAFLSNALRLPRWAKQREQQIEYIAARVAAIVNAGA